MSTTKIKSRLVAVLFAGLTGIILVALMPIHKLLFTREKLLRSSMEVRPGGTGDLRTRTLIPFLQKHIPGNPFIRYRIHAWRWWSKGCQLSLPA